MKLLLLLFALLFTLKAQTSKSLEDIAKEAHLANINALLIFTSQDGLNTGLFRFTKVDADMQIYNFPFLHHFESQSDYNLFVVGNVGYSRVSTKNEYISLGGIELSSDSHLQTYTGGVGLGGRYKLREDLSFMGGVEFIYSRSGVNVQESDADITTPVEDFFGNQFNTNLSYKIFVEGEYKPNVEYFKPYVKYGYKFFDTKSDMDLKNLAAFRTQSSVFSLSVGGMSDPILQGDNGHFTLGGYLNANYLAGDVVKSIEFKAYSKVGTIAHFYHQNGISWIEHYFLELSTINADGLEGYNVGLGFKIDY